MDFLSFIADVQARDVISFAGGMGIGSMASVVITYRLTRHAKHTDARLDADRKLYAELMALLQPDGAIAFLRHISGGSFRREELHPFDEFDHSWRGPERHFHDKKVDAARLKLYTTISDFLAFVGVETFDLDHGNQGAPPAWKHDAPERYERVVRELHDHAEHVIRVHQAFVQAARKRLHV
jgi:hypothetical protein